MGQWLSWVVPSTLPCKAVYNVRKSMATPHATKLNTRQLKFVQGKLTGKSNARAAREAGYSESVARVAGRKLLGNPAVQAKLDTLMCNAGLSDERLSAAIQGRDIDRVAQIGRIVPYLRRIVQSFILALAAGETDQALSSLRALEKNLKAMKATRTGVNGVLRADTMEELRRKVEDYNNRRRASDE
jgi:Terminase small subunit